MEQQTIGIILDQLFARYLGLSMISTSPFEIAFFQTTLAIRDHIISSREGYSTDHKEYTLLKWTATGMTYLALFQLVVGVGLVIKSL